MNMKKMRFGVVVIFAVSLIMSGCASMNKATKGAAIGTAAGGAMGAVIGQATGNPALGAIIGATVGGATGAVIGHQMDKQAEEIKETVPDAKVERVGEGIVVEFSSAVLFGFDQSEGNRRPHFRTPIKGLYLTGASTFPGAGVESAVMSAMICANDIAGWSKGKSRDS